ncbi:olfactory receptor 502-like [Ornithorhynchus anatinus]|uniref:G-protein coupled receptors family 1 profile domain-containing protein n=1 Tax=Ornithorhynchus anatinus TaxID=9258 RepID=F7FYV4_ORNAN|nr:olfactory receptor 502-like [Ornithorhynchus anatinus]
MAAGNGTMVTEFILFGFTDDQNLQTTLFVLFLVIYTITLMGNLGIIMLIRASPQLHTPMYYFLSHLSLSDMCYSSTVTPKMLENLRQGKRTISFGGCALQFAVAAIFGTNECFLLAVMAFDRYSAICRPLLYPLIMSNKVRVQLVLASYIGSCVNAVIFGSSVFSLSFCGPNEINHFCCDFPPLMELACSDTRVAQILNSITSILIILVTILIIAISYLCILSAILRIPSTEGKHKAFSTCASHLTAVTLFYGTLTFIYTQPNSRFSMDQKKVVSVFYMVVIPMLNPLIYSLRNKDVKEALRRIFSSLKMSGLIYAMKKKLF